MELTFIVNNNESAKDLVVKMLNYDEDFVMETIATFGGEELLEEFRQLTIEGGFMGALMIMEEVELLEFNYKNGMLICFVDWMLAGPEDLVELDN